MKCGRVRSCVMALLVMLMPAGSVDNTRAFVTLVSGSHNGYSIGAVALGQSLIDVGSKVAKVAMVGDGLSEAERVSLVKVGWVLEDVEPLACKVQDINTQKGIAGYERWRNTCTKFRAWGLVRFKRVVFLDADMLVVRPIDDVLYDAHTNATFAAAPESIPPDTFNAGFMLLTPSARTMAQLLALNKRLGSIEGGDQGMLNSGLCPNWYTVGPNDPHCGRLPWRFNVQAAHYDFYENLQKGAGRPLPTTIHFVNDGKPWSVLQVEYMSEKERAAIVDRELMKKIGKQALAHMLWRKAYFKAIGDAMRAPVFLQKCVELARERSGAKGSQASGTHSEL